MIAAAVSPALEPPDGDGRARPTFIFRSAHKCGYCDFASLAGVDHLGRRYLQRLEREIETRSLNRRKSTRSSWAAGPRRG